MNTLTKILAVAIVVSLVGVGLYVAYPLIKEITPWGGEDDDSKWDDGAIPPEPGYVDAYTAMKDSTYNSGVTLEQIYKGVRVSDFEFNDTDAQSGVAIYIRDGKKSITFDLKVELDVGDFLILVVAGNDEHGAYNGEYRLGIARALSGICIGVIDGVDWTDAESTFLSIIGSGVSAGITENVNFLFDENYEELIIKTNIGEEGFSSTLSVEPGTSELRMLWLIGHGATVDITNLFIK